MKDRAFVWFLVWTILALVVLWQYDPVHRKLDPDASFMLYAGQQILRGHAPYVGVTIVKLPVSPFVAALGIAGGRAFGMEDVLAGRLAFWLCAGIAVGAVYLIGARLARDLTGFSTPLDGHFEQRREISRGNTENPHVVRNEIRQSHCHFERRREISRDNSESPHVVRNEMRQSLDVRLPVLYGSFAAAIFLSFQTLGIQVAKGPEAKLPMLAAGMLCLVLVAREKFFWAGIASAVAFMAWQPGLIFVAAALVAAFFANDRKRALAETAAGAAISIFFAGAYLAIHGALGSMFRQAFGANANYLGDKKIASGIFGVVAGNLTKVWDVALECSATEVPFVVLGIVGMLGGAALLLYHFWKTRARTFFLTALPLFVSGAGLFGFSFLDMQKCSDLVPLLPYLALGAASPLIALISLISFVTPKHPRVPFFFGIVLLFALLIYGTYDAFTQPPQNALPEQRALAMELNAQLESHDRVQQFGDTVFIVIAQRENATRFVHLGEKQGLGIMTSEGVSMEALIQQLQTVKPRVITLSRAKNKEWAAPLYAWIQEHYAPDAVYNAAAAQRNKDLEIFWVK